MPPTGDESGAEILPQEPELGGPLLLNKNRPCQRSIRNKIFDCIDGINCSQVSIGRPELHQVPKVDENGAWKRRCGNPFAS